MQLDYNVLVNLLNEVFNLGQTNSYELRDQVVDEIVLSLQNGHENWITMSLEELHSLPSGKKMFHSLFGEGTINIKSGQRFVQFGGNLGFRIELNEEGWPWNEKIQIIS